MKIYFAHSSNIDYKTDLYLPIKSYAKLWKHHEIILPHDQLVEGYYSKDVIKEVDFFIADVSYPSIGLGMEIAWADNYNKPILALYKENYKISSSLNFINTNIASYQSIEHMLQQISSFITA